jgi:hypothetical protein
LPTIKTKRTDIYRSFEVKKMLDSSEPWLQCLIALSTIFGKRVTENLKLMKEDVWQDDKYLYVRFFVGKKKTRKDAPVPKPYLKRIQLHHPLVHYITDYIKTIPAQQRVFGKMTRQLALYYLKKVNSQGWWHLFRESLATEMAERGATEEQLMHWFDWDRVDTAHEYVKRGTKLTEQLSERIW